MISLQEILALEDIDQKIQYLKKGRKTELPDRRKLWEDWNPDLHEIMTDKKKYPDRKVLKEEAKKIFDEKAGKTYEVEAKYETEEVNRITIPLEQDIVNIQTAFTVGTEPSMDCAPSDDNEKGLLAALKSVLQKNKIKYQNKRVVRSWLSEQEVAEYWYVTDDDSFWTKFWAKVKTAFGGKAKPTKKLRSVLWSPFRGDKLYPFFDDYGDLVAISREFKKKDLDDTEISVFMTVTKDSVYQWELNKTWSTPEGKSFKHGFPKLPVLYAYRPETYCHKVKTFRVRLEKLLSSYADCIDYHFFPILQLVGDVEGFTGKKKDRIVKLMGEGAGASYLTWDQVPTTIELELKTLFEKAYSMTNTPQISFESLKGSGNALSGVAFDYVFLSTHLQVENHAEVIGDFMQRRVNFLVSALGTINPYEFDKASQTIDIDVDIVPYRLDNVDDKVSTAVKAVEGGVWSQKRGVMFAGITDQIEEEIAQIKEEQEEWQSIEAQKQNINKEE
ncbi:phage portal protein [Bacteroides ihuae]|uniref:phage portal protein n=1 Tax=Bacteroides ihuae TaxID=1852362 RepID=UPI0008D934BD|nr:phage portal protein [Bacteroides ihuae]